MQRILTLFVIVIMFACNPAVAGTEPAAGQRDLVKESGLDLVFQGLGEQFKDAAAQSEISSNAKLQSAWIRAVDEILPQEHLEETMRAELTATLDDDDRAEIYRFLDSAFGQRVAQMERQSMQPSLRPAVLSKGKELVSSLSERRTALLKGIMESSGGRQTSVAIGMNMVIAMLNGMKIGGLFPQSVDDTTLNRIISQQRPKIEAAVDAELPAAMAFMYQQLSDEELDRYLSYLSSTDSVSRNDKVILAVERVVSAAVTAFGIRVATLYSKAVRESDL